MSNKERTEAIPDRIADPLPTVRELKINYCAKGRCELKLENGEVTYLTGGEISVDSGQALNSFYYPGGEYEGFEVVVFMDANCGNILSLLNQPFDSPQKLFDLALAMMLRLRDEGAVMSLGAFLLSPWTDMTCSGQSYYTNYRKDVEIGEKKKDLTPEKLETIIGSDLFSFIGNAERTDPYVSPVFGGYEGFPPTMICVGDDEMLLDDSLQVIQKMQAANVPVICERKPGMFHTYVLYMDYMPESKESFKKLIAFVKGL